MITNNNWMKASVLAQALGTIVLMLGLSGCLSTLTPTKPSVVKQIQQQEIKDTIDQHIAEFKTIKPAIDRLIAMENDFKVMVSQIAKINNPSAPSTGMSQMYTPESTPVGLDPHEATPELEVLYVSDTAQEPEPIFAIADPNPNERMSAEVILPADPIVTTEFIAPEQSLVTTESIVSFQPAEPFAEPIKTDEILTAALKQRQNIRLFPSSSYPTCAPLGVSSDARKYGIHVASFDTMESLPRGWQESVQRFPDFCQKGAVIQRVVVKSKEFYSLRVGPYVSRSEAKSICYALKKQKQYCRVTDFTGETL